MMMIKRAGDDERFSGQKPQLKRQVDWGRIARLFRPYCPQQAAVVACIVAASFLNLVPSVLSRHLVDVSLAQQNMPAVLRDVGIMIGAALLAAIIGVVQGYFNSFVGQGIMRNLRVDLVSHLFSLPLSFFTTTRTGAVMNRVTNDADSVVTGTLSSVLTNVISIVSVTVVMVAMSWNLAVIALIVVPINPIAARRFRDGGRRARSQTLGPRAAAFGDRARVLEGPAHLDSRRSDQFARFRK